MTTRQYGHYVEVAEASTGNLRLVRQYVEILTPYSAPSTTHNETINESLTLTDSVNREFQVTVNSSLTLTDAAAKAEFVSIDDEVLFEDFVSHFNYIADREVPSSTLTLTDSVTVGGREPVETALTLTDEVTFIGPRVKTVYNNLFLSDLARNLAVNQRIEDTLNLVDYGSVPIEYTVEDTLTLIDEATITNLEDVLELVDTVAYGKSVGIEIHDLNLSDTLNLTGTFTRPITEAFGLGHALTYFIEDNCGKRRYAPYIGETTVTTDNQPSGNKPESLVTWNSSHIELYYPATGDRTSTVSLRAPELDNRDRMSFTRVNHETRGGYLIAYADDAWPKLFTLIFTFIALTKAEIESIQTFFHDYLGQTIGLTDWEGRRWTGVITDPEQPASEDSRVGWTISFTFEGEREEEDGDTVGFSDSAVATLEWSRSGDDSLSFTDEATYVLETP
jgi:hypothetical protein